MIYRRNGETWLRLRNYGWGGETWYEKKAEGETYICIFFLAPRPPLVQTL